MKHRLLPLAMSAALLVTSVGCSASGGSATATTPTAALAVASTAPTYTPISEAETAILLSDSGISVDGTAAPTDPASPVYTGAAIVYYEAGRDATYGEGAETDGHTAEEAAAQTVVTITQPGTYRVSGTLSAGQLSIDLGEDAAQDPDAVVTLILDGADITCAVAPGVIFYNVYECGSTDAEAATQTVDTTAAGANVVLADGSVNYVDGSYVAKIYQEGTDKKLHKYDGAFYSKMSMNVFGEAEGTGTLHITAANEGLDSELHLTINGGTIWIEAQNDGINTSEDGLSVATINGGTLSLSAGLGAEGDGIDSNGFLVINGGEIVSLANGQSGDGGLDSDQGIYLNGGSVLALGSRNDAIAQESTQSSLQFNLSTAQKAGSVLTITDADGKELLSYTTQRDYQCFVYSTPDLTANGTYAVAVDGTVQENAGERGGPGGGGGQRPDGELPQGEPPADKGERPEGTPPAGYEGGKGGGTRPSAPPDGAAPSPAPSAAAQ